MDVVTEGLGEFQEMLKTIDAEEFFKKIVETYKEQNKDLDAFLLLPECCKMVMYKITEKEARLFLRLVRSGLLGRLDDPDEIFNPIAKPERLIDDTTPDPA